MSTRDMTINQIKAVDKDFGSKHTIKVSGFKEPKDKMPPWFQKFLNEEFHPFVKQQLEFNKYVLNQFQKQEQFNKYVIDQFEKHGWTK